MNTTSKRLLVILRQLTRPRGDQPSPLAEVLALAVLRTAFRPTLSSIEFKIPAKRKSSKKCTEQATAPEPK